MPGFEDSAVIILLALLIFGPKKLPELARYVGKLMNEFRRASAEFRMQMDDEFRQIEQTERQQKIAAMEAAAPIAPAIAASEPTLTDTEAPSAANQNPAEHPAEHPAELQPEHIPDVPSMLQPADPAPPVLPEPLPIASNGQLDMMPPATGLPVARTHGSPLNGLFDSIPQAPDPAAQHEHTETPTHG